MIEQLIKLKNFIEEHSTAHPELEISEEDWNEVVDVYDVLLPAKIATKILQVRFYINLFSYFVIMVKNNYFFF